MSFFVPFNKFDLIASEKVGIQENWIMRIENQLCMMDINFIIVKDIDDIQKLKKDLNPQKVELEKRLDEISTMNHKEMVCLINQVREYCALRIQNAERIHTSDK